MQKFRKVNNEKNVENILTSQKVCRSKPEKKENPIFRRGKHSEHKSKNM